ncbi:MAG: response regulator transcription factor [Schwartzia sp.]|nr:response regulator transcription factor [Schwartzia sp. (in: firmicutes)]
MRIAVCDSDDVLREELKRQIRQARPEAAVLTFASGEALLAEKEPFALVFLDIRGVGGLSAARRLRERERREGRRPAVLVFVTGYREHMAEAFDVQAFHYLVKPIEPGRFREVFERAWQEAEAVWRPASRFLLLKAAGGTERVFLKDILYMESANKKVLLHTTGGTYETGVRMEALELSLGPSFYRCHRCYLVNLEQVAAYGPGSIRLTNGDEILIAQRKYAPFVRAFLRYAREGGLVHV